MKNSLFIISVTAALMAAPIFNSCRSKEPKVDAVKTNLQDDRHESTEISDEEYVAETVRINPRDWDLFKVVSDRSIKNNIFRIVELELMLQDSGRATDPVFQNKIAVLEERNRDLRNRLIIYENEPGSWEVFRTEFNRDMNKLIKDLKDFPIHDK
jgi:hypothetical protein